MNSQPDDQSNRPGKPTEFLIGEVRDSDPTAAADHSTHNTANQPLDEMHLYCPIFKKENQSLVPSQRWPRL